MWKEDRIVIDWQDVSMEGGCRWDWTLALYAILHPKEDVILYLGKADGTTVRTRWNADDKHERVWRPYRKMSWVSLSTASLLENSAYQVLFGSPGSWVADVEALLIHQIQAMGQYSMRQDQECLSARHRGLLPR